MRIQFIFRLHERIVHVQSVVFVAMVSRIILCAETCCAAAVFTIRPGSAQLFCVAECDVVLFLHEDRVGCLSRVHV